MVLRGSRVLIVLIAALLIAGCTSPSNEQPGRAASTEQSESSPTPTPPPGITEDDVAEIEDAVRTYRTAGDENDFATRQHVTTGRISDYFGLLIRAAYDPNSLPLSSSKINKLEVVEIDADTAEVEIDVEVTPFGEAPEPSRLRGTYRVVRTDSGWKVENFTERGGDSFASSIYMDPRGQQEIGGVEVRVVGVDLGTEEFGSVFFEVENHSDKRYGTYEAILIDDEGNQYTGSSPTESSVLAGAKLFGEYQFPFPQPISADSKRLRLALSFYDETTYGDDLEFDIDIRLK